MKYIKSFMAGFLATLIFHQGLLYLLSLTGLTQAVPYNLKPTSPFGVPSVLSLAFFGGLWGILLGKFIAGESGERLWIKTFLFGAIAPTLGAVLIVFPIKEIKVSPAVVLASFILNGVWGLGTTWLIRLVENRERAGFAIRN